MNIYTDLRALYFTTALHGNTSILAPIGRMVVRFARRAVDALRHRSRPIEAITRSALARDGFSIDTNPFT
jgi:hypothetical protein